MNVQLDETLIAQARRAPRHDGLSLGERIALNLLWRKKVRVPVLAKVFQCSKNTIYYNCLDGRRRELSAFGRQQGARDQRDYRPDRRREGVGGKRHRDHDPRGQRREQGTGRAQAHASRCVTRPPSRLGAMTMRGSAPSFARSAKAARPLRSTRFTKAPSPMKPATAPDSRRAMSS